MGAPARLPCRRLRGSRYDALEADHADLGLRAEEALAGQEALSLEHQKVIQEAKELQGRQAEPDQAMAQEASLEEVYRNI